MVPPLGSPDSRIVKGQVRFWGYDKTAEPARGQFSQVVLQQSPSTVAGGAQRACAPQECARQFEGQAEENVLARLFRAKLLGVTGDVEKMLDKVVNNLVIADHLLMAQQIHCRLLLTTRLEAFTVGNTIVVSRGLVDVLPGEAAIALVLAHHVAHNVLGHPRIDTKLGFPDVLRISDAELLAKLRFHHTVEEEKSADQLAVDILRASIYQNQPKMRDSGLAMQALQAYAPRLSQLISPSFGEHVADVAGVVTNDDLFRMADVLDDERVDQVPGLPLGSNLLVNPMNGRVELFPSEPPPALKPNEKLVFAVTPFMPFLAYYAEKPATPKPPVVALRPVMQRTSTPVRQFAVTAKKNP